MKRRRIRRNPTYGSVEQFITARGPREFSMADLERNIGGPANLLALELGRLINQGRIIKSSRSGGVQFYQAVSAVPTPKPGYVPTYKVGEMRDADVSKAFLVLSEIPEIEAMRAHNFVERAKTELTVAMRQRDVVQAAMRSAQQRRDRAALMQAENALEGAEMRVARAKRALADAERDLRRLDPEHFAPKRNPRRKRRRK